MNTIPSDQRPYGMSQLDWVWVTYSPYLVANVRSEVPSDSLLLTESAIFQTIEDATSGSISNLTYEEDPDNTSQMRLVGTASNGEQVTIVYMPKEEHITSFSRKTIDQDDVDSGCPYDIGTDVLEIATNIGSSYYVSLDNLHITAVETKTIYTAVSGNKISSKLKISDVNDDAVVEIKTTNDGIYNELHIDENSEVTLSTDNGQLTASIPLLNNNETLKFTRLTLNEYLTTTHEAGVLYFISDSGYFYLDDTRYGVIDIFEGKETSTAITKIDHEWYTVEVDVKVNEEDSFLYVDEDKGISTGFSVEQDDDVIYIYGRDKDHVVGSINVNATLQSYIVIHGITEDDVENYFPRQVDGKDYDPNTNPVKIGDTYIILTMGATATSKRSYNLYINTTDLVEIPISTDDCNLLTTGSDGGLFVAVPWHVFDSADEGGSTPDPEPTPDPNPDPDDPNSGGDPESTPDPDDPNSGGDPESTPDPDDPGTKEDPESTPPDPDDPGTKEDPESVPPEDDDDDKEEDPESTPDDPNSGDDDGGDDDGGDPESVPGSKDDGGGDPESTPGDKDTGSTGDPESTPGDSGSSSTEDPESVPGGGNTGSDDDDDESTPESNPDEPSTPPTDDTPESVPGN